MGERYDVLIVGAGHGGAQAAIALRQKGFVGSVAIVGEEPEPPYERPPLSKDYLSGQKTFERILIRPATFWSERSVAMLLGRRIVSLDPVAHVAVDSTGVRIEYGSLVWAAGGHARRLSCAGFDLAGVHSVRTRADVDQLRDELDTTTRVAVVGGGYVGLEAAAVLAKAGKQVTVLEAQDRVLARVAGVALSRFYEAEHRAQGVDVRLGVQVESIEGDGDRARGVRLASGERLPADMVIVGIGIVPEVVPLLAAGAAGGNGVSVDAHCRTTLPDVYAIGDCALHANRFAGGAAIRLESVQNAHDMATTVAAALTGALALYDTIPWFWSTQYHLKLQTIGLSIGHDVEVVRGDPEGKAFSIVYLKMGRVVALDCVNVTRDFVQGRALVIAGALIGEHSLADATRALKELVAS